jgi:hypothetical protein
MQKNASTDIWKKNTTLDRLHGKPLLYTGLRRKIVSIDHHHRQATLVDRASRCNLIQRAQVLERSLLPIGCTVLDPFCILARNPFMDDRLGTVRGWVRMKNQREYEQQLTAAARASFLSNENKIVKSRADEIWRSNVGRLCCGRQEAKITTA